MSSSYNLVSMTKRLFWPIFQAAWLASFTKKSITSAFAKTGIFLYKPTLVLDKIQRPLPLVPTSHKCTQMTCRAVQKVHKAYRNSHSTERLTFILHANIYLAAQASLNKQTISGLISSLKIEKKKRSHRKRPNLVGEKDSGLQFFTLHCIPKGKG